MSSSYQAERTLKRDGVPVDLYQMEADGDGGSRGTSYSLTDDSPHEILVIPDPGGRSLAFGIFGAEIDADQVYFAHQDEGIDDGGGEGASVIVQDGEAYRVEDADRSQRHGFAVLECSRDTEVDLQ